jgi:plasmid stabilization system protein ParE
MTFNVRFTSEAQQDIKRLYEFILERDDTDYETAQKALTAIRTGIDSLKHNPFSCRKTNTPFLRELVISFGATGYVALFEIESSHMVTILAIRHQREEDCH